MTSTVTCILCFDSDVLSSFTLLQVKWSCILFFDTTLIICFHIPNSHWTNCIFKLFPEVMGSSPALTEARLLLFVHFIWMVVSILHGHPFSKNGMFSNLNVVSFPDMMSHRLWTLGCNKQSGMTASLALIRPCIVKCSLENCPWQ